MRAKGSRLTDEERGALGSFLVLARKKLGLSQGQMSERLGRSCSIVEAGWQMLSVASLRMWAEAYEVSVDDLISIHEQADKRVRRTDV